MSKEKFPKLYKRKWLNNDKGSAYVIIDADVSGHWNEEKYPYDTTLDAIIEIKDCNRQIVLEFYANDEKEYKKRLVKIQSLLDAIKELQQFMLDNPPHTEGRKKKKKPEEVSETEAKDPATVVEATATLNPVLKVVFDEDTGRSEA